MKMTSLTKIIYKFLTLITSPGLLDRKRKNNNIINNCIIFNNILVSVNIIYIYTMDNINYVPELWVEHSYTIMCIVLFIDCLYVLYNICSLFFKYKEKCKCFFITSKHYTYKFINYTINNPIIVIMYLVYIIIGLIIQIKYNFISYENITIIWKSVITSVYTLFQEYNKASLCLILFQEIYSEYFIIFTKIVFFILSIVICLIVFNGYTPYIIYNICVFTINIKRDPKGFIIELMWVFLFVFCLATLPSLISLLGYIIVFLSICLMFFILLLIVYFVVVLPLLVYSFIFDWPIIKTLWLKWKPILIEDIKIRIPYMMSLIIILHLVYFIMNLITPESYDSIIYTRFDNYKPGVVVINASLAGLLNFGFIKCISNLSFLNSKKDKINKINHLSFFFPIISFILYNIIFTVLPLFASISLITIVEKYFITRSTFFRGYSLFLYNYIELELNESFTKMMGSVAGISNVAGPSGSSAGGSGGNPGPIWNNTLGFDNDDYDDNFNFLQFVVNMSYLNYNEDKRFVSVATSYDPQPNWTATNTKNKVVTMGSFWDNSLQGVKLFNGIYVVRNYSEKKIGYLFLDGNSFVVSAGNTLANIYLYKLALGYPPKPLGLNDYQYDKFLFLHNYTYGTPVINLEDIIRSRGEIIFSITRSSIMDVPRTWYNHNSNPNMDLSTRFIRFPNIKINNLCDCSLDINDDKYKLLMSDTQYLMLKIIAYDIKYNADKSGYIHGDPSMSNRTFKSLILKIKEFKETTKTHAKAPYCTKHGKVTYLSKCLKLIQLASYIERQLGGENLWNKDYIITSPDSVHSNNPYILDSSSLDLSSLDPSSLDPSLVDRARIMWRDAHSG